MDWCCLILGRRENPPFVFPFRLVSVVVPVLPVIMLAVSVLESVVDAIDVFRFDIIVVSVGVVLVLLDEG